MNPRWGIRQQYQNIARGEWKPTDTVDIVAHSFGGLVARRVARMNADQRLFNLRNVITCGTPLGGHNGAQKLVNVEKWAEKKVLSAINPVLGLLYLEMLSTPAEFTPGNMARNSELYSDVPASADGYPRYRLLGGTNALDNISDLTSWHDWANIKNNAENLGAFEPVPHDSVVSTAASPGRRRKSGPSGIGSTCQRLRKSKSIPTTRTPTSPAASELCL